MRKPLGVLLWPHWLDEATLEGGDVTRARSPLSAALFLSHICWVGSNDELRLEENILPVLFLFLRPPLLPIVMVASKTR